jgi:glycosyltransferase involved in cell wall biosynthesis
MKDGLVIIPAYNEAEGLPSVIERIAESPAGKVADLLIINDGSTDGTGELAESLGALVVSHVFNMGYGAALQTGYKYAAEKGYKLLLQMDADAQHDIANLRRMLDIMYTGEDEPPVDMLIGSRFLPGSVSFHVSKLKMFAIHLFRSVIKQTTGATVTDPTSGLQALSRSMFVYFSKFNNFHYAFPDLNVIVQALFNGYTVQEFPAIMHDREGGVSMHSSLAKNAKYMLKMAFSTTSIILRERSKRKAKGQQ